MDSLKRITVLLLAAALVYAGAAALHPPKARAGINAGVVVNNLPSQPVPISGIVGIDGTPTVQLATGTTVGVTGGTFNFSNTPSTPIFTNPAPTPFQTTLCKGSDSSASPCSFEPFFIVGANRLVIEYVSVSCIAAGGSSVYEDGVQTTAGGRFGQYSFPPGQTNGMGASIANQQVRIYADPGSTVRLGVGGSVGPTPGVSFYRCSATLSGNLVTP